MIEFLHSMVTPVNFLMMNMGVAAGIIIGALPGLNVVFAIAVLLPFTFGMDSVAGMYLLLGTYCGGTFGGSISAILINTPGTPSACATVFDGYPMAQHGKAGDALKISLVCSCIGGILSCLALIFLAPQIAKAASKFGAPEFFSLCIFGMSAAVGIAGNKPIKGLVMVCFGLMISTVGIDTTEGVQRFMFGQTKLLAGIAPVTVMLGVFALTEVLDKSRALAEKSFNQDGTVVYTKASLKTMEIFRYWKTIVRSSAIGIVIGAIPGTGGAIAAMLSYNEARRKSKCADDFGHGTIEGIMAPETGNNATTGATLIPLLTLGIPGDASVAVLLGALTMQGIIPGPSLFSRDSIWVYAIMGGLLIINILLWLQGSIFIRLFANIVRVPLEILLPCIVTLCILGAFSISNSVFDILLMNIFGIIGYGLRKNDFPLPPLIISLVLGNFMESNLRRSLVLSQGSAMIFLTRPVSVCILVLSFFSLFYPLLRRIAGRSKM